MAGRVRDERGGVAAHVAVLPAVLALFFLAVQASLWFYARSLATSAAQHGLDAARVYSDEEQVTDDAVEALGETTALDFLEQVGGLENAQVEVDRGPEVVTVIVTGDAVKTLPGINTSVEVTLEAPVERLVD